MSGTQTDNDILSSIPGLDEFMGDVREEGKEQGSAVNSNNATQQPIHANDGNGSVEDPSKAGTGTATVAADAGGAAEPTDKVIQRKDGLLEKTNPDNPRVRDLVDPTTGRIVAHGGIERHVFETAQRHRRENEALKQEKTQWENQRQNFGEVVNTGTRLGLQPQQQVAAMQAMADFLRDPVKFATDLVTEIRGKGFNLPFLENGVTPAMDMAAIQRMMDAKMAPITQQETHRQQQIEIQQRAEQELNGFLDHNPNAQANLDVIGRLITADPSLTLDRAYTKLIEWASSQGLDYSQPFGAQLLARQQGAQQAPVAIQPQQRQVAQRAPLPNGRGTSAASVIPANGGLNELSSWRDIISVAMTEAGMKPN